LGEVRLLGGVGAPPVALGDAGPRYPDFSHFFFTARHGCRWIDDFQPLIAPRPATADESSGAPDIVIIPSHDLASLESSTIHG